MAFLPKKSNHRQVSTHQSGLPAAIHLLRQLSKFVIRITTEN